MNEDDLSESPAPRLANAYMACLEVVTSLASAGGEGDAGAAWRRLCEEIPLGERKDHLLGALRDFVSLAPLLDLPSVRGPKQMLRDITAGARALEQDVAAWDEAAEPPPALVSAAIALHERMRSAPPEDAVREGLEGLDELERGASMSTQQEAAARLATLLTDVMNLAAAFAHEPALEAGDPEDWRTMLLEVASEMTWLQSVAAGGTTAGLTWPEDGAQRIERLRVAVTGWDPVGMPPAEVREAARRCFAILPPNLEGSGS